MKEIVRFLREARMGYLFFTSLIILGVVFGAFEIIDQTLFKDRSQETMQWLYFSRGVIVSLMLMVWAAWTVYNYREYYEDQLEATKMRYSDIIEHSADAIISIDNENNITSWNQGAEDMLGWQRGEILGREITKIVPDELIEMQELECIEFGMKFKGNVTNYETERLTKTGEKKLVNLTESYIRNKDDEIVGRSQILRDLTDIKMKEEQIQQSERLATVGHMAAGVAHEVGNPLTAISSLVQVCQRKTDDEFIQDQLKKVRDHIQRINKIVRDLVDFSRPSSMQSENVQINEIIESAVGLLQHDARCRDVKFEMNLSPRLPLVSCVPDQIHQVLVNLLLNSVDAMEEEDNPKVTIVTEEQDGMAKLTVSDIGKGIKEEHQSRIFEPFFTTKEVGSGTGLGLSVSHGIINKIGGSIQVESNYGEGTTFIIKLPTKK
ncbi:MAG: PAS domain S-box protein [Aliifodinibius sp.]|nr:PAS domain S-box protein [candidate division Zixibacteria bacterium]NIT57994.1 PAS domain S-box protein [Fodinibius sp.]NIU15496.1 PAS domain S-box protein [candidate division Zixibacteria bacterium]NIX56803.1 PAS domain S-box protein [candidate division Zixibacteria bacterium]NIY26576.1 PAS domain S-box protein [Fodinibius sp.]